MHPPAARRLCRLFLLAAFLLGAAGRLPAMSLAGRQDRRQFEAAVKEAFLKEDYAALEATVAELRVKKDRFPEGLWTLSVFYSALEMEGLPLHANRDIEARLGRWQEAQPGSVAVRLVRVQALLDSRWQRTEEDLPASAKTPWAARLRRARAELDAAAALVPAGSAPGPDWFAESLRVAGLERVPREEFEALFARAVAAEPGYHRFYFLKAGFLENRAPRGAWEAFALEAGQMNLSGEGMGIYSRIAWSRAGLREDGWLPRYTAIEWPRMRDGFRDLERAWPGSEWNLNNFCHFACLAGDRGTARELFARIGDQWTTNWLSHTAFKGWRTWATSDVDPAAPPAVRLGLPAGTPGAARGGRAIAFAPDGESVFISYDGGRVVRWDAGTGAMRWQGELGAGGGGVCTLALSPDGRTLAVGTASNWTGGYVGKLGVWDVSATGSGGEPAAPTPPRWLGAGTRRGGVHALHWAADGRSLVAAGGSFTDNFGELCVWAMPEGREVRHISDWPLVMEAVAFLSPDGRRLVQASAQGFNVFESATGEKVFSAPDGKMHACSVRAMALSPDGKTLACGTGAGFMNRDHPAEIAFWDTATWTRRPPAPGSDNSSITNAGGTRALAWSPDGRLLLSGGYDGFLRVWDAATGKSVQSWPPEPSAGQIIGVAWSPDGRRAAAARSQGSGSIHAFSPPPAAAGR